MNAPAVRKAVIPVAGMGTRFLPATKAIPKELLPLVDKPVVQYIVEEAASAGIEQVVFIISDHKAAIEQHFSHDPVLEEFLRSKQKTAELTAVQAAADLVDVIFVEQHEPLGLGHAVLQAREVIGDEPFIVFGGDDVVQGPVSAAHELIEVYQQHQASVIGVLEVPGDAISRYGVIDPIETVGERSWRLRDIVEKPTPEAAPSSYGVGGRWLLTPNIFEYLQHQAPGAGGEIQLTDAIRALLQDQQSVFAKAYSGIYRDCGNKLEYLKAVVAFGLADPALSDDLRSYLRSLITGDL